MSYYKMMKSIEEKIAAAKATKRPELSGSGLLARTKMPVGPASGSSDITEEVADYIMSIRRQKEELMNGKT
jgi:hypothetical protein